MTMDILDRGPVGMIGTACFGGVLCLGTLVNATSAQPAQDYTHLVTIIVSITGLVAAVASLIASFASLIRARDDEPRRRRRR